MAEEFELETNTVWSFPKRGKWATHLKELQTYNLIDDNIFARLNQKREEYNVNSHVF